MTSAYFWQNSISPCSASFRIPRPNFPVTPGVSWLPTFAFQSPIMKRTSCQGLASAESRDILSIGDVGEWRKIEIRKEWHGVTKLQWARPVLLYFPRGFYTLSCTYSKVKNVESTQHFISNNFYRYQVSSCKSLCQEPAWGIPPMTRSCGRALMARLIRPQVFPLEFLEHPPPKK